MTLPLLVASARRRRHGSRRLRVLINTGAVAGLFGWGAIWYAWANAVPTVAPFPTPPLLPSPNARDTDLRAVALLTRTTEVDIAIGSLKYQNEHKHVYTLAEKEALVTANAPALRTLREGFAFPFANPPMRSLSAASSELPAYRRMARLLRLEADVRAQRADYAGAVNSSLDAEQFGTDVPRGGPILPMLVGYAVEAIGRRPLWKMVDSLDGAAAQKAARRLETLQAQRPHIADSLTEEKYGMQAEMGKIFQHSNTFQVFEGMGLFLESDEENRDWEYEMRTRADVYWRVLPYSKQRIMDNLTKCLDANIASTWLPYQQAVANPIPEPADPVSELMVPNFAQMRFKDVQTRMESNLLTAVFALRAYQARHGSYPENLQALVTDGILENIPADPFSATSNAPLGYRRLGSGKHYLLYSVGPDGKDDGGVPVDMGHGSNPSRHWPEADDKGDWVIGVNNYRD